MFQFGEALHNELESVTGKKADEVKRKKQRVLQKWLGLPQQYKKPPVARAAKDVEQQFTVKGDGS